MRKKYKQRGDMSVSIKRKRILIIGTIFIVCIIILGGCRHMIGRQITETAKKYVAETFIQEMQHLRTSITIPIADGASHRVYFSPVDNPELVYLVAVNLNRITVRGDTYYAAYFEMGMKNRFMVDVLEIWNNDAQLSVSVRGNREEFKTPENFNPKEPITETLEQMAEVFYNRSFENHNFIFIIETNQILNDESKDEEVERMLAFVRKMQNSVFRPRTIMFSYTNPNPSIWDGVFNNTHVEIRIHDWITIETKEQIKELLGGM